MLCVSSQTTPLSPARCRAGRPPGNLVAGQSSTMCIIVCYGGLQQQEGNSPQILPVAAVLHNRRRCTSSKTARRQAFLMVSRLYILLKIARHITDNTSGSTRKAYVKERQERSIHEGLYKPLMRQSPYLSLSSCTHVQHVNAVVARAFHESVILLSTNNVY